MSTAQVIAEGTPKYLQLKELIIDRIRKRTLQPGADIPTQREMMAQFGLSYSTVSRALQDLVRDGYITRVMGSGSVVAETAMAKLRGPLTVHLIGGIPEAQRRGLSIFQELLEAGRELGLKIVAHEDQTQAERTAYIDAVLARKRGKDEPAEGFIFPYFAGNREHIDRLKKIGAPYVVMDVPLETPGYNVVLRNHRSAARVLVERLIRAGHEAQRVGLLLGRIDCSDPDAYQWDQAKAEGAADVLGGCNPLRTQWDVSPTLEDGERATRELLARAPDITALFCDNAEKARGACRAIVAMGKRVPEDISIACINVPGPNVPALAHAGAPAEGVGRAAASILFDLISGKAEAPLVREIAMCFDDGASIAPLS
jgi:DNA-binding LacI/PurR family transcriptional regulator